LNVMRKVTSVGTATLLGKGTVATGWSRAHVPG